MDKPAPAPTLDRHLPLPDAAAIVHASVKTLRRAISRGELRATRLGTRRGLRVAPADLRAWIDSRLVAPTPAPSR